MAPLIAEPFCKKNGRILQKHAENIALSQEEIANSKNNGHFSARKKKKNILQSMQVCCCHFQLIKDSILNRKYEHFVRVGILELKLNSVAAI